VAVVLISDGVLIVTVEEVQEQFASATVGLEPLPDVNGDLVVYERHTGLRDLPVKGRVKTKAEAELLVDFVGQELTVTERDGTISMGWRVRTDPPPAIRRKDGDSPDYLVELKLWRLP
jgi:hypothetical protein